MGQIIRFPAPNDACPGPSATALASVIEGACAARVLRTTLLTAQGAGIAPAPFEGIDRLLFAARRLMRRRPAAILH
jgi:hypothetical protein